MLALYRKFETTIPRNEVARPRSCTKKNFPIEKCHEIGITLTMEKGNEKASCFPRSNESTKTSGNHCKQISTLQMHCTENSKQIFPEWNCAPLLTISTFMYCEWLIYSHHRSSYFAVLCLRTHRYINVEIVNEAVQFNLFVSNFRYSELAVCLFVYNDFHTGLCWLLRPGNTVLFVSHFALSR